MANLTALSDKIKSIVDVTPGFTDGLNKIVFDDLSKINGDLAEFPLMLVKPPVGDYEDRTMTYKLLAMDVFVFTPELDENYDHWTKNVDKCEDLLTVVLRALFLDGPNYILVGKVKVSPGHMQHNAKLTGARAQFNLRVFNPCA